MALAYGDGFAALIGKKFGWKPFYVLKKDSFRMRRHVFGDIQRVEKVLQDFFEFKLRK